MTGFARVLIGVTAAMLALGVVAVLPSSVTVEQPEVVVGAGELVGVAIDERRTAGPGGDSGAYLHPRTTVVGSVKAQLTAWLAPDRSVGPRETGPGPGGVTPFDVALMTGAGVAPGRTPPSSLGLAVAKRSADVPGDQLALLLYIADQIHPRDLADGRRILALGSVAADGTLRCSADPRATLLASSPPPDLVLVATGCGPFPGWTAGVPVIEVGSFAEAFAALSVAR